MFSIAIDVRHAGAINEGQGLSLLGIVEELFALFAMVADLMVVGAITG